MTEINFNEKERKKRRWEYFHVRFLVGANSQRKTDLRALRGERGTKWRNKHVRDKFRRKKVGGTEFSKRRRSCLIKIAGQEGKKNKRKWPRVNGRVFHEKQTKNGKRVNKNTPQRKRMWQRRQRSDFDVGKY